LKFLLGIYQIPLGNIKIGAIFSIYLFFNYHRCKKKFHDRFTYNFFIYIRNYFIFCSNSLVSSSVWNTVLTPLLVVPEGLCHLRDFRKPCLPSIHAYFADSWFNTLKLFYFTLKMEEDIDFFCWQVPDLKKRYSMQHRTEDRSCSSLRTSKRTSLGGLLLWLRQRKITIKLIKTIIPLLKTYI
jgi:hypothetical protein